MFDALDAVLETLISPAVPGVSVSFAPPDGDFERAVGRPALSVFLYDVGENTELRTDRWDGELVGTVVQRRRPPVRVECSYLITAWASTTPPHTTTAREHQMLGSVLTELVRHRHLPERLLAGTDLAAQPFPLPARVLGGSRLQSVGEFWQAIGGRPKAALHYGVTLAVTATDGHDVGGLVQRIDTTVTTDRSAAATNGRRSERT